MKAIQTKYLGATNHKPSRIVATAEGGHRVSISYPHEFDGEAAHAQAALALCKKLGWKGKLVGGGLPNGDFCFCFVSDDTYKANPLSLAAVRKGVKKTVRGVKSVYRTGKNTVQRGRNAVKGVKDALKAARDVYHALHPGKPLPPSLASKKKNRQKNPRKLALMYAVFEKTSKGWKKVGWTRSKAAAFSSARSIANNKNVQVKVTSVRK